MALRLWTCLLALAAVVLSHPSPQLGEGATAAAVDKRATCYKGVRIFGTKGGSGAGPYGIKLPSLINQLEAAIPGSYSSPVIYPHDLNLEGDIRNATAQIQNNVINYVASCPNSYIVLLGYSEGAMATMNAICGGSSIDLPMNKAIDPKYAKNVIAVIAYGDESRAMNQPWNRGTCKTLGPFVRLQPQTCDPYAASIQDYCDMLDTVCCLGGTNPGAHQNYPKYNDQVTAFVLSRYNGAKAA